MVSGWAQIAMAPGGWAQTAMAAVGRMVRMAQAEIVYPRLRPRLCIQQQISKLNGISKMDC
jgi:hypothetical protein